MLTQLIPKKTQKIEEYTPNTTPCKIRLDANESPFLPSKSVLDELSRAVYSIDFNRYPDPYASELVAAFSKIYRVAPQNVVAGNGSDELISIICTGLLEAGDSVSVVLPDFSMYEFYSSLSGANVVKFVKSEDFEVDFDAILEETKKNRSKIVILSNPCNPSGSICKREQLERFIRSCGSIVVIDEAYMEFSMTDESVIDLTEECENLIVLKTLSKAFGSAALRLGFAISGKTLASTIRKIKSPYNVNTVSQVFGRIILEHYSDIEENIRILKENAKYLSDSLAGLDCDKIARIYNSAANFVFVKLTSAEAAQSLKAELMRRGIAIRCMSNGFIRITAGSRDEIDEFLLNFKEAICE